MFEVQPRPVKRPPVSGPAALVVFAVLLVTTGAVAFAAGPSQVGQSSSPDPSASTAPAASSVPGTMPSPGEGGQGPGYGFGRRHGGQGGPGGMRGPGRPGFPGFPGEPGEPGRPGGPRGGFIGDLLGGIAEAHAIRITAIDGNNLSLATNDGWTRTIDASTATVTRDGAAAALADLKVGDTIQLREQQNSDGTWTVTAINAVQPHVGGTVQAVASDSLTLSHVDGSTTVVHVSADTTYRVIGMDNGTLADIEVGNIVEAAGTLRDDGSLDATSVVAFNGAGFPHGPWGDPGRIWPNVSPAPSASANG